MPQELPSEADRVKQAEIEHRVEEILRLLVKKKDFELSEKQKEIEQMRFEIGSAKYEARMAKRELQTAFAERDELARRVALLRMCSPPTAITRTDIAKSDSERAIREVLEELRDSPARNSEKRDSARTSEWAPDSIPGTPAETPAGGVEAADLAARLEGSAVPPSTGSTPAKTEPAAAVFPLAASTPARKEPAATPGSNSKEAASTPAAASPASPAAGQASPASSGSPGDLASRFGILPPATIV